MCGRLSVWVLLLVQLLQKDQELHLHGVLLSFGELLQHIGALDAPEHPPTLPAVPFCFGIKRVANWLLALELTSPADNSNMTKLGLVGSALSRYAA